MRPLLLCPYWTRARRAVSAYWCARQESNLQRDAAFEAGASACSATGAYKKRHALAKACRRDHDLVLVPLRGRTYLYPVGYQLLSRSGWDTYLWPMLVLGTGTLQKPQRRGTMRSIHTGQLNIGSPPFSKLEPRQRTDDAFCHVCVPISRLPGSPPGLRAAQRVGASEGNRTLALSVEG